MTPAGILLMVVLSSVVAQLWLFGREIFYQKARRSQTPECLKDQFAEGKWARAVDYTVAKLRLAGAAILLDGVLLLLWSLGGGLVWLHGFWARILPAGLPAESALLLSAVVLQAALHRGLEALRQFAVEQPFGFCSMTAGLFLRDSLIKGALLLVAAGGLGAVFLTLVAGYGSAGWVGVWLVWTGFLMVRIWLYPVMVAPLFDRYSNLEDEELAHGVGQLVQAAGSRLGNILIMDGSRRSTHGNAHVAGFGGARRVVLLDTLVDSLTRNEILGVLAHELGHLKYGHLTKFLVAQAGIALVWIIVAGLALEGPEMRVALNLPQASPGAALALVWVMTPVFAILVKPAMSRLVRGFEFQADGFAVSHYDGEFLCKALLKLHGRNAATEASDPLFSYVYHSHPPLVERLARLRR